MIWRVRGFWMIDLSGFDWRRVFFVSTSFVAACAGGYFGQPCIHNNEVAIGVVVNVFSVLSGFLMAVMAVLGEPTLFAGLRKRDIASRRKNFYQGLARQKWLFVLYLLVLGFLFVSAVLSKSDDLKDLVIWFERFYLAFAIFAFILSLALPHRLMAMQQARFDELLKINPSTTK